MKKPAGRISTLLDWLFKYSIAAILIFIPLYPKFPLFTVPFTYVNIRAEDFLIVSVWVIFLIRLLVRRELPLPKITFQVAVYLFVAAVSSISAILITKNVQPLIVALHFFRRIEYLSVFFLVYWAGRTVSNRRYFLELAILPAIGVFLYGIAQIYFRAPVISTMDAESSKGIALTLRPGVTLSSTFAGHYDLAVYLTMIMTFLVSIASATKGLIKKIPIIILFLALVWLFMQAGSRISLLGLVLAVCLVSAIYRRFILGVLFLAIIFSFIATSPQYIDRFKSIFIQIQHKITSVVFTPAFASESAAVSQPAPAQDISTNIRLNVEWPRAIRALKKNPLLGTGYSSITLATDNDYLRAMGETGLIGFFSFVALLLGILYHLVTLIKKNIGIDKLISVSALGVFTAFLITAIFIDVFESSKIAILFWAFMGLAFSTDQHA